MGVLTKDYADREAFAAERAAGLDQGGLLVQDAVAPELRGKVRVVLTVGGRHPTTLEATVVYVSPPPAPFSIGLELAGDWKRGLADLADRAPEEPGKEGAAWGRDAESVHHRIGQMSTVEKVQLAVRAGREERRILMKDAHHQAHVYLLKNPKITTDEVAQMCKSHNITPDMLIDVSQNLEWMRNATIRLSVIKNPKTPSTVVKKHIQTLNDNDLYALARSDSVRESVSRMARNVLAQKGKKIE